MTTEAPVPACTTTRIEAKLIDLAARAPAIRCGSSWWPSHTHPAGIFVVTCGLLAQMMSMFSASSARPNWVTPSPPSPLFTLKMLCLSL